jgi:hypothetical protein
LAIGLTACGGALAANSADDSSATDSKTVAATKRGGRQLREAMHTAMRREALAKGPEQDAALRNLVAIYQKLEQDTTLPKNQRLELLDLVRRRLASRGEALQRRLRKEARPAAKTVKLPSGDQGVLAQQAPIGRPPVPPAPNPAQDLIDLIQSTIVPSSWDVNGGPGSIKYWAPGMSLVVSQTQQVQDLVGQVVRDLRK